MEQNREMNVDAGNQSENTLDDSDAWKLEAEAVINDVKVGVKDICVSQHLTSTSTKIYLNVTTLENDRLCIELTARGFKVVGKEYDMTDEPEETFFETPNSLLSGRSALFREAFSASLIEKLTQLQRENVDLEESD
uniref:GSKIP domain-containing protein n=1 Tax=Strigamia maritima TaxID=126957 RepID=T1JA60_STRMM